ncbi:hypothetical protein N0V90_003725 [Kalmusia sp. IMI 367209]|nr:hypothetical protein N0V90_003725 [Kalmusia sp. IMI 367209]
MSVYSGDGSEHAFPHIKLERGSGWTTDEEVAPSATVAPGRLTRSNNTSYDGVYSSPMSPYASDSTPGPAYTSQLLDQLPSKGRPTSSHSDTKAVVTRKGYRRGRKSKETARYSCEICGTGFVRMYNKNTHMARHNPDRPKDNICTFDGCDMKFERKTDLDRHINSVHLKLKLFACDMCGKRFPRKDTLASEPQAYYPSPRPEVYTGFQTAEGAHELFGARSQHGTEGAMFDARFTLFRDEGYGANPHGL